MATLSMYQHINLSAYLISWIGLGYHKAEEGDYRSKILTPTAFANLR